MFENSYKIRVSARAIVFNDNRILLNCFGNGIYYNLPGGGIEERENARLTVAREVYEETGLKVSVGEFVFALEYEPWSADHLHGDGHHISFVFRSALQGGNQLSIPEIPDIDPLNPSMISQPVWIPLAQLTEIVLLPHINQNLLQYFKTGVFEPKFITEPYE